MKDESAQDLGANEQSSQDSIEDNVHDSAQEPTFETLQKHVVLLQQQLEESNHKHLLAKADLDNYRRRARKEIEECLKYSVVPMLEGMIPVLDNFERAMQVSEVKQDPESLREGIEMVYKQFSNVLTQLGLKHIETEGQQFDPRYHQAVMQVEAEGKSGMVLEELQKGYQYLDRVIRPTMVKVGS